MGFPGKVILPSVGVGFSPISLPYLLVLLSIKGVPVNSLVLQSFASPSSTYWSQGSRHLQLLCHLDLPIPSHYITSGVLSSIPSLPHIPMIILRSLPETSNSLSHVIHSFLLSVCQLTGRTFTKPNRTYII